MFSEDKVPACRCTAHPPHEDKKKYMYVAKEESDYVVWCCKRCTEISKVPTIQVSYLPKGVAKAAFHNAEYTREKNAILGRGRKPKVGNLTVREDK